MTNRVRVLVTMVVVGALFAPAVLDRDDFPLSTYPMYAQTRGDVVRLVTAHGLDAEGASVSLSMATLARTDDPLIAASALRRGAATDPNGLCHAIASRVAADRVAGVVVVRVVSEDHDVVERARDRPSVRSSRTLADCEVET